MRSRPRRFLRLHRWWIVLRGLGGRARDLFPFTPLGLVTVGAAAAAFRWYGLARIDLLYLVIGAVGVGLAAVCLLSSTLAALRLRLALRGASGAAPPLRLQGGVRVATDFSIPSLWYLPLSRVRWSWIRPEAAARGVRAPAGRLSEEVTPARRGLEEGIERRLEVSDAFALTRIAFRYREPRAVRVVPSTGALDRVRLSRTVAGGDDTYDPLGAPEGERLDLRGYAPGDPIRFVLWKVFARSRQLVVRTPERALSPARKAVAYLVTGPGDEAAAGVARQAVESGGLGSTFVLGADGVPDDARSPEEARELLARSGATEGNGEGLARFLLRASPLPGARAVIFVPALPGPWVAEVAAAARSPRPGGRSSMQIVVCADGLDRRKPPSLLRRILTSARRAEGQGRPSARKVEALVETLARTGAEVILVDRVHGRVYAGGAIAAPRPPREPAAPAPPPAALPAPEET